MRYFGLLASQSADHHRLCELAPPSGADAQASGAGGSDDADSATAAAVADPDLDAPRAGERSDRYRMRWAALPARVFRHDMVVCSHCGGERRIVAAITERDMAATILIHLGLPTDVPDLAPARAPPQADLFTDDDWPAA